MTTHLIAEFAELIEEMTVSSEVGQSSKKTIS